MPSQLVQTELERCGRLVAEFFNPPNRTWEDGANVSSYSPPSETSCHPDFDKTFCWDPVSRNSTQQRECPFTFCPGCQIEDRYVKRECLPNGTWAKTDYSACIRIFSQNKECIQTGCNICTDPFKETVRSTVISLCVLSILLPTVAFVIFVGLKSLHSRRLTIHIHLVVSFIFRFLFFLGFVLAQEGVFNRCPALQREPVLEWEWLCKALLWLLMYFQLASVFWMFVEGGFLVSRFTVFAMRNTDGPLAPFLLVGWGVPLVQMITWSILTAELGRSEYCWMPFTESDFIYVLVGPMGAALILNFLFLLTVIGILVKKLRAENTAESQRIWKTIKATILLVPLLGIANILLFYEPEGENVSKTWRNTYQLMSAILQHSQGASVAILYCFANAEVQRSLKRAAKQSSLWHWWSGVRSSRQRKKKSKAPSNTTTTTVGNGAAVAETALSDPPAPSLPPSIRTPRSPDLKSASEAERAPLAGRPIDGSLRSIPHIDD